MGRLFALVMASGLFAGIFFASYVLAQESVTVGGNDAAPGESPIPASTKKPLDLPKTGVLATSMVAGGEGAQVDMPWGSGNEIGNLPSPILGSIMKREGGWVVRLSNASKDRTLSVNVELAQYNGQGRKVKSDPFSYSLTPGAKTERMVTGVDGVRKVELLLTGWKEK